SGVLALGGTWLSGRLLASYGFPDAYALSFLFAFVILTLGVAGFPFVKELPASGTRPRIGTLAYLRSAPVLLREDTQFGTFVLTQVIYSFSYMAPAFYTAYALDRFQVSAREVALFTTVLMASTTLANLCLGLVADRRGNKPVLQVSMCLAIAASILTLLAPSNGWMYAVFALNGVVITGANLGGYNMPLEFAPRPQVPTYSAVSMTAIAPFRAVVPLFGGALAVMGYGPVFGVSAISSVVSLVLLTTRVRDPRHRAHEVSE
ncbi:MAG: MFS transporter, partial [Chloroflexota bacterium]|nr:MFS transporter [Chloroflexota bacterium]